jgi:hypothetical protein
MIKEGFIMYRKLHIDRLTIFKKWDIIIIVALLCLSFIPELIFGIVIGKSYNGTYAEITLDGKLYKKVPLSEHSGDQKIEIKTSHGYNIIEIKDQAIRVLDADCPDKICIKPGFISKPGENLVCLPHKLIVTIKGYKNQDNNDIIITH